MMGFFATFAGFLYNDFMSIPIEFLANSCYKDESSTVMEDCVYPFGLDPRWYRTASEITYVNSLKMKLSVIFGVS
jgi:V-type H+-transporting ATPase subunit a